MEQIGAFLVENGIPDDTGYIADDKTNYSAFYFAKKYKDYKYTTYEKSANSLSLTNIIVGGNQQDRIEHSTNLGELYAEGWYLPSVVELFQVWKNKDKVESATVLCGGMEFKNLYLSSSQYEDMEIDGEVMHVLGGVAHYAYFIDFETGKISGGSKSGGPVVAIREF